MPADRRLAKTQNDIKQAFYQLIHQIPFEKISVTDIANAANISRRTFYAHFLDKFDLLEKIENEFLYDFEHFLNTIDLTPETIKSGKNIPISLEFIDSHYETIQLIFRHHSNGFAQEMVRIKKQCCDKAGFFNQHKEYKYAFFFGGLDKLIREWLQSEGELTTYDFIHIFHYFILKLIA